MRKLIVAALLIVGITAFAQQKEGRRAGKEKLSTEEKVELHVKRMTKDLDLNEKQVAEVRAITTKQVQKMEAKRAEIKDVKEKQRAEMKANREKEQAALSSEMKKILTPEQYAKWEKNREEKKGKMKERMLERREKRGSE